MGIESPMQKMQDNVIEQGPLYSPMPKNIFLLRAVFTHMRCSRGAGCTCISNRKQILNVKQVWQPSRQAPLFGRLEAYFAF